MKAKISAESGNENEIMKTINNEKMAYQCQPMNSVIS
jgi:hypothetical protein